MCRRVPEGRPTASLRAVQDVFVSTRMQRILYHKNISCCSQKTSLTILQKF